MPPSSVLHSDCPVSTPHPPTSPLSHLHLRIFFWSRWAQVNGRPIIELPPRRVLLQTATLEGHQAELYRRWEAAAQGLIAAMERAGDLLKNYSSVLELLLRLRQVCCHPRLCPVEPPSLSDGEEARPPGPEVMRRVAEMVEEGVVEECPICLDSVTLAGVAITRCGHVFCRACIEATIAMDKPVCPLCRAEIRASELYDPPSARGDDAVSKGRGVANAVGTTWREGCGVHPSEIDAVRDVVRSAGGVFVAIASGDDCRQEPRSTRVRRRVARAAAARRAIRAPLSSHGRSGRSWTAFAQRRARRRRTGGPSSTWSSLNSSAC